MAAPESAPEQVHRGPPPRRSTEKGKVASTPQGCCRAVGLSPGTAASKRRDARRARQAVENGATAIENQICHFRREEERVWQNLEEVRRRATAIESGGSRLLEKRLADRAVQQGRDAALQEAKAKVAERRSFNTALQTAAYQEVVVKQRQLAAQRQRLASVEVLQRMRMDEMEARLRNSERAVAIQREKLEAAARNCKQREIQLAHIRQERKADWQEAKVDVLGVESVLCKLEAKEMECLRRLRNSREISRSVLQELEASLGARSPVAALLRAKQKDQLDLPCTAGVLHAIQSLLEEDGEELAPEDVSGVVSVPPRPDSLGG